MSFKFTNSAGQTAYLLNTSFTKLTSGQNCTLFGWLKGPASKLKRIALYRSWDASQLNQYADLRTDASNIYYAKSQTYSGTAREANSSPDTWDGSQWNAMITSVTLSGNVTLQYQPDGGSADTEKTAGPLGASWNTSGSGRIGIGASDTGGNQDTGMTFYIAHVAIWTAALDQTTREALLAGANPLAYPTDLLEYWSGASATGYNATVLTEAGTGTITYDDADNPTVDAPPGGAAVARAFVHQFRNYGSA